MNAYFETFGANTNAPSWPVGTGRVRDEKEMSGCAIAGIVSRRGRRFNAEPIIESIANMHERGNGLGGGFAAYGVYPRHRDNFCFHLMFDHEEAKRAAESFLDEHVDVHEVEEIPTRAIDEVRNRPLLWRCRQGFVAGCNMAGGKALHDGSFAMNSIQVFDLATISVGITTGEGDDCEVLETGSRDRRSYRKVVLRHNRIVGAVFIGEIDRAGLITGLLRGKVEVTSFKDLLLTEQFGLIHVPAHYRKHVVAGRGIEV